MRVIGITGGIGASKSRILGIMQNEMRAVVCQADQVAHKLQQPGQVCYDKIVEYFGGGVLNEDKTINRSKLGTVVFSDSEQLKRLNQIVHPEVKKCINEMIERERASDTSLFVVEAALLIEDHYETLCDEFWYIYADENSRRERLKRERGYSDEKVDAVFASQASDEIYRSHCRYVIDNSGEFEMTCRQIRRYLGEERDEIM